MQQDDIIDGRTTAATFEPWAVQRGVTGDEIIIRSNDAIIATVPLWEDEEPGDGLKDQSKANARLIAAAPALQAYAAAFIEQIDAIEDECSAIVSLRGGAVLSRLRQLVRDTDA